MSTFDACPEEPCDEGCYNGGMEKRFEKLILFVIILLGTVFRFYNLDWDKGHYFHPDERNIALAVTRIRFFNQMNPEFFAYGSLPIYMYRVAGDVIVKITGEERWTSEWGDINLIGRHFSAFFSSLTILLVYLLARKMFSPSFSLVAAWFTAMTPFLIQQAHFAVTESMLAFWAVLLTYLTLFKNRPILLGYILALAVATKMSAISFGIIPGAFLLSRKKIKPFLMFLLTALAVYAALSPYTFLSWNKFMESMNYEGGIVSGKLLVVYVYQFLQTKPYIYQLMQLLYTQGFLPAIASVIGYIWIIVYALKYKKWLVLFIFLWPTVYFAYVGGWYAKFVRYLVPIYPFLAISAAYFVTKLIKFRPLFVCLLLAPLVQSIAFMHIYTTEQTRFTASSWIYDHIPKETKILTEHWDDGLPVTLAPEKHPGIYQSEQLTIYDEDNEKKIVYYAETLSKAEYIVINSRRLYGTLVNLEEKYPVTSKYYKLLFNGSISYQKIAEFTVYPTLGMGSWQWEFNDDKSEESFQVYDHPHVMIFQNTEHLSPGRIGEILRQ